MVVYFFTYLFAFIVEVSNVLHDVNDDDDDSSGNDAD